MLDLCILSSNLIFALLASGLFFLCSYCFIDAQASVLVSANKSDVNSNLPVLIDTRLSIKCISMG